MNIKTAIEEIIKLTIPDSVNGIHIKTDLREVQSLVYHDQRDLMLTIMPVEIKCEDVAVSMRICLDTFPSDFSQTSLAYKHLQRQIEETLMTYMRNLKNVLKGDLILAKCVQLNNDGWDSYAELELGGIYEVDHADVDRCHTDVYLKGMTNSFNSVCFKFYKDGQEIDIVREYIDSYYRKYSHK